MGTTPETTATVVTEKLTFTPTQRDRVTGWFIPKDSDILGRIKVLLPYHRWTLPQIVASLHESADAEGKNLVLSGAAETKMRRSFAVVKAWVGSRADELVDDDTRDQVLTNLGKIANIDPGALEKYLLPEADWPEVDNGHREKYRAFMVSPKENAKVQFEAFLAETPFGSGINAMLAIVETYMSWRIQGDPEIAAEWLNKYRWGVEFANNEKRTSGQAHDTIAADARVGDGTGTTQEAAKGGTTTVQQDAAKASGKGNPGARNQGGTGSAGAKKEQEQNAQTPPAEDHRTPNQKTLGEASLHELAGALILRIVDYTVAMTPEDAKILDEVQEHYDARLEVLPLGQTIKQAAAAPAPAPAAQSASVLPGSREAMSRAILAELGARGLDVQAILAQALTGQVTQ